MSTTAGTNGGWPAAPLGVVAAIDHGPATRPVLAVARRLARCFGSRVTAVHVEEDAARCRAARDLADAHGVELLVLAGDPTDVLERLAHRPDVEVVVLGAHDLATAHHRLGHVADALVHRPPVPPIVLVPAAHEVADRPTGRVLLPLDTDAGCAAASEAVADRFRSAGCEVVGLHVFEPGTVPAFLDHPGHGTTTWRREFARRHGMADVELRRGAPARRILETAREQDADLVVLAWSCVMQDRRGEVVTGVLTGAEVPVLLVPVAAREDVA